MAGAAAIVVAAGYMLTPRTATARSETWIRVGPDAAPRVEHRRWTDSGGGRWEVHDRITGDVLGRFIETPRADATLSVEWKTVQVRGLVLAPRIFGFTPFALRGPGGERSVSMTTFLRPDPSFEPGARHTV